MLFKLLLFYISVIGSLTYLIISPISFLMLLALHIVPRHISSFIHSFIKSFTQEPFSVHLHSAWHKSKMGWDGHRNEMYRSILGPVLLDLVCVPSL